MFQIRSFFSRFDSKDIHNWFLEPPGKFNNPLRIPVLVQIQKEFDEIL